MYHLETQSLRVHYRPGRPAYSTPMPKPPGKGKEPEGGPATKASKLNDGGRLTRGKEKAK